MTFYRKYRPQSLDDLLGQDTVKQTLKKAFEAGKLSHAYLFEGPRGSGKTSTARILAKMVNCQSSAESNRLSVKKSETNNQNIPCNSCSSCNSITDGSSLDLIEIDAASNRGIDDIRELREKIKLAPAHSKKKVYIIDEVHMLTTEAFNALLKTLEEPPVHVLFIMATTDPQKIPQTILSRVQSLKFRQAKPQDLVEALKKVSEKENIPLERGVLELLASKADGSFRDALKILDQLSSSNDKITKETVENALMAGKSEEVLKLALLISQNDSAKALSLINDLNERGVNFKEFTNSLIELFRQMLLIQSGAIPAVKEDLGSGNFEKVLEISQKFEPQKLINVLNLLSTSLQSLKFTPIPSLPLEIAVAESCIIQTQSGQKEIKGRQTTDTQKPVIENSNQDTEGKVSTRQYTNLPPSQPDLNNNQSAPKVPEAEVPASSLESPTTSDDVISDELALLKDKWQFILETVKPYNYSLEALLKQAKIVSCEEGIVTFEVPYSFHQRILQAPKSRNLLESVLADVLGKTVKVNTVIGKRPVRVEELANVEIAADDEIIQIAAEIFNS